MDDIERVGATIHQLTQRERRLKWFVDYPGTNLMTHRLMLGEDRGAILVLPNDLTTSEAKRLSAFLETLVVDHSGPA